MDAAPLNPPPCYRRKQAGGVAPAAAVGRAIGGRFRGGELGKERTGGRWGRNPSGLADLLST